MHLSICIKIPSSDFLSSTGETIRTGLHLSVFCLSRWPRRITFLISSAVVSGSSLVGYVSASSEMKHDYREQRSVYTVN